MRELFLTVGLFIALCATAQPVLDAAQEERFARIAAELRCLVCQNQSIADSHADLAVDLRLQIREQIAAGRSDDEIKTYMSDRYGDFVLYRPPLKGATLLLWFGPALLLIAGTSVLLMHLRARRRVAEDGALNAEEQARAAALLQGGQEGRDQ